MILSYDNEGKQDKDDLNESIEMAKIKTIEGLLTQKQETVQEGEQDEDKEKENNSNISNNIDKEQGDSSQYFSSRDAPLSREEQCFQTDVWQEIEKSVVQQNQSKPNLEDHIINISSESSTSSHQSKNYILKSELRGLNNENNNIINNSPIEPIEVECKDSRFAYFLSNTTKILTSNHNHNNNVENTIITEQRPLFNETNNNTMSNTIDNLSSKTPQVKKKTNKSPPFPLSKGFDTPMTPSLIIPSNMHQIKQTFTPKASTQCKKNSKSNMNIIMNNGTCYFNNNNNNTLSNSNNIAIYKPKMNYESLSLEEILELCPRLSLEQIGCRFLQKRIDEYPGLAKQMYLIIKSNIIDISCNSFGNYLVQKIIEHLSIIELDDLIRGDLSTHFKHTCLSSHGTRVIQKYFEMIYKHDYLVNFFNILLKPNIVEFTKSPNASHIIIKYVSLIQSPRNDFIIQSLNANLLEIATNKHSCCALQKCLESSNMQQKQMLLMTIANISPVLFVNQFGNYVIQFALMFADREVNKIIINNYLNDFPKYSSHKFASNIYEKCLDFSEKDTKKFIIEKLCNPTIIQNLLFDTYGNYVLQKTIQHCKEPYRSKYISMLIPLMEKLQMHPFGHKIYQKFITNFPELSQFNTNYQPNMCYSINNYGNVCYQNNYYYAPKYFQNGNMNMNMNVNVNAFGKTNQQQQQPMFISPQPNIHQNQLQQVPHPHPQHLPSFQFIGQQPYL